MSDDKTVSLEATFDLSTNERKIIDILAGEAGKTALPPEPVKEEPKPKPNQADFDSLGDMLSYCRPHKSNAEMQFIKRFIRPLGVSQDAEGNLYKRIGKDSRVLWSCHTDTVHTFGGRQELEYTPTCFQLPLKSISNCLGADDTAGVWLMREMIKAKVPGLYVFHRNEEKGATGSRWIAKNKPNLLKDIDMAIALDRNGKSDVITFQQGSRCCSDDFASALAKDLGGSFSKDPGGLFTDTAIYTDLIPECTNLSVGYTGAHSNNERQDYTFLFELRDKLCSLDVKKLPVVRKAGEKESRYSKSSTKGGGSGSSMYDIYDFDDSGYFRRNAAALGKSGGSSRRHHKGSGDYPYGGRIVHSGRSSTLASGNYYPGKRGFVEDLIEMDFQENGNLSGVTIYDLLHQNTRVVAEWMQDCGITMAELYEAIMEKAGYVNR